MICWTLLSNVFSDALQSLLVDVFCKQQKLCPMKLPGDDQNGLRLEQLSILDRLAALVDKSMIQTSETEEGEIWLTMLETIREYGWECLQQSGEAEVAQHSHALYYLSFAEKAELHLQAAQQGHWRRRLQQEQGESASRTQLSLRTTGSRIGSSHQWHHVVILVYARELSRGTEIP